jgi:hypothetical protein
MEKDKHKLVRISLKGPGNSLVEDSLFDDKKLFCFNEISRGAGAVYS